MTESKTNNHPLFYFVAYDNIGKGKSFTTLLVTLPNTNRRKSFAAWVQSQQAAMTNGALNPNICQGHRYGNWCTLGRDGCSIRPDRRGDLPGLNDVVWTNAIRQTANDRKITSVFFAPKHIKKGKAADAALKLAKIFNNPNVFEIRFLRSRKAVAATAPAGTRIVSLTKLPQSKRISVI